MDDSQTTLGKLAYEANKEAWPPASLYVPWEHLTDTARDGWSAIAEVIRIKVQDDAFRKGLEAACEYVERIGLYGSEGLVSGIMDIPEQLAFENGELGLSQQELDCGQPNDRNEETSRPTPMCKTSFLSNVGRINYFLRMHWRAVHFSNYRNI